MIPGTSEIEILQPTAQQINVGVETMDRTLVCFDDLICVLVSFFLSSLFSFLFCGFFLCVVARVVVVRDVVLSSFALDSRTPDALDYSGTPTM